MTDTDAIYAAIDSLRTLDHQDRLSFFARAKVLKALKELKPHKSGYNGANKLAEFWVSIGLKPSTAENYIRVYDRFHAICADLDVIPTRLQKALACPRADLESERELAHLCTDAMPYTDFLERIAVLKGKPEQPICDHSGPKEVHHKCLNCGHWAKI